MKEIRLDDTVTEIAVRPTKGNPDVKVVIGKDSNNNYVPKSVLYPDDYTGADIQNKIQHYNAVREKDGCKVCDRFKAEQAQAKAERNENIALILGGTVAGIIICSIISYYISKKNKTGE